MEPTDCSSIESWVGRAASRQFPVTDALIGAFADLSGDRSPIHVDETVARDRGLQGCVMHGALQASLVSCVLGMDLPGPCGMLQQLALQFRKPCYAGDQLTVTVEVEEAFDSVQTISMSVRIVNQDGRLVTSGKAQSGVVLRGVAQSGDDR
ncbi:MAG TPA: MaoC family dehydratase [Thermoguttaceae bacterium]|nr:MaoC family dehydratase [Thermoguttaceae bacterium]